MPGFLSHYIAGQAVYKSMASDIRKNIEQCERLYNLGSQGPDIFFYCLPGIIRKRSRGVGMEMHQNDLGIFITRMAHIAKNSPKSERDIIFSYAAGFIMHYVFDVHAHPYVYAQTYDTNAARLKNSADHRIFETAIDIALLKLVSGQKPANYHQWELISAEFNQLAIAATAMSKSLKAVYNRPISPKDVYQAMRHMIKITRLLRSRKGRRKKWVELAENFTLRQPLFSSMIHDQEVNDDRDYLNEQKQPWKAPWDEAETCTDSFVERYAAAVTEGLQTIECLHAYVYGQLPLRILAKKLGNRSLKTGLPCGLVK